MATTYSSRFYTSAGVLLAPISSMRAALQGISFSETIATTVLDGLDEHYLFPLPGNGLTRLHGFFLGAGKMDTNATPLLDADLVLRTSLNAVVTDTIVYNSSDSGLFSALGGFEYLMSGPPKVGATAGWAVNGAANLSEATLPAAQTASTLVVPIYGLRVGDKITSFRISAQIESAGNTATLDADLRKMTNAAADPTDASVGAITQVSVTADTAVAAEKTGLAEVVAFGEFFYILITGTTAAATDVRFLGASVTIDNGRPVPLKWVDVWSLVANTDSGVAHMVFKVNTAAATAAAANLTVIPQWM